MSLQFQHTRTPDEALRTDLAWKESFLRLPGIPPQGSTMKRGDFVATLERSKSGDKEALDTLILWNVRLVISQCEKTFTGKGIPLSDLFSIGLQGLSNAIDGFDPSQGTTFSTYASKCIRRAISNEFDNTLKGMSAPSHHRKKVQQMRKILEREKNTSVKEMAKEMRSHESTTYGLLVSDSSVLRLDAACSDEWERFRVTDGESRDGQYTLHLRDEWAVISKTIQKLRSSGTLTKQEVMVLGMFYRLDLSYAEIARRIGVVRERPRQIHNKAIEKIQKSLQAEITRARHEAEKKRRKELVTKVGEKCRLGFIT